MSQPKSMEAAAAEEAKEVMLLLEGRRQAGVLSAILQGQGRNASPITPRSPVRSMLDIGDAPPRHASIPGANAVAKPRRGFPVRSMLDVSTPSPSPVLQTRSAVSTPTEPNYRAAQTKGPHRSLSDAATRPAAFGLVAPGIDKTNDYQFSGYLQSNPGGPVVPKRNTLAGKMKIPSAMAEVMKGDLSSLSLGRDKGRLRNSSKSQSPHGRHNQRSDSPSTDPTKYVLKDGTVMDMNSAYRRLSDANLALSGGGLSSLSEKGRRRRADSGEKVNSDGSRLKKDYTPVEGDESLMDSSDYGTSDEERQRGRRKEGRTVDKPEAKTLGMGRAKGPRTAQSLSAAIEEERLQVSAQQKGRLESSHLDPEITVTGPSGDKLKASKARVHPNTSYDDGFTATPGDSDAEKDVADIKQAQKLIIQMTPVISTPATNRCVRTIYRGNFAKMQEEAQDHQRRVRKYLVATDLSDEAAHALEWTIGTVLRDGDTLLAIYCVDEELGMGLPASDGASDEFQKEQAVAVAASTKPTGGVSTPSFVGGPAPLPPGAIFKEASSAATSSSPMGRLKDKAEQERHRAVQDITDRVNKLLRKTRLQVKVVVEVIHCKSPKHLITEVIDYINPTLVILGSRGRSALKGVILGSFSNYLVTKSSVPVMVARKRLRKLSQFRRPAVRLANNLAQPTTKSIATAKID